MAFYSILEYTATGVTSIYTTPPYIEEAHLTVTLGGVGQVLNSDYTLSGTTLTFSVTPTIGSAIRISRKSSPDGRVVDYTSGAGFSERTLDLDSLQAFYLAQEGLDLQLEYASAGGYPANLGQANAVQIGINQTNIATNAADIATNTADITAAKTDILANSSAISGLLLYQLSSGYTKRKIVRVATDFGTIDPTVEYFIDGVVDMGSTSIEIPAGGINIRGYNLGISKLVSTAASYTMFTSPVGGSGNVLGQDFTIDVSGTGSQVYDIVSQSGFDAIEFARLNYENCTSLGSIDNYRQGLEEGTGRFGGTPSLTLVGTWVGGFRVTTSIVRSLDAGMTEPLFKAGAGFTMNSRFLTDINADLPPAAPFVDFAPSNFPNASTVQIQGAILTRGGTPDATDSSICPNLSATDLSCSWVKNIGLPNTFVGGIAKVTANTTQTAIAATGTPYDLVVDTWADSNLAHFDTKTVGVSNRGLRNLGVNPRDFRVSVNFELTSSSGAGDQITLLLEKYTESDVLISEITRSTRSALTLSGTDRVIFHFDSVTTLDTNEYVKIRVQNETDTSNYIVTPDSYILIEER